MAEGILPHLTDDNLKYSAVQFYTELAPSRPADLQQYDDKFISAMNKTENLSPLVSSLLVKLATDEVRSAGWYKK